MRGLKCPLPVLKLEKAVDALPAGATIVVRATDPVARIDIPLYCRQHGLSCASRDENGVLVFAVTKVEGRP